MAYKLTLDASYNDIQNALNNGQMVFAKLNFDRTLAPVASIFSIRGSYTIPIQELHYEEDEEVDSFMVTFVLSNMPLTFWATSPSEDLVTSAISDDNPK